MADLAVNGCELEVVSPGTGVVSVTSQPSTDILVNDKGVFFKEIKFSVSGSNGGGSVTNNDGTGSGSITASGANVLDADGNKAVLEGDVSSSVQIDGHAGESTASGTVIVRVKKAGQTSVSAT